MSDAQRPREPVSSDPLLLTPEEAATVLRLGRNAALFDRSETTQQEVVHAITAGVPTKVSGVPGNEETGP